MLNLGEKLGLLRSVANPPAPVESYDVDRSRICVAFFRHRCWAELLAETLAGDGIRAEVRTQGGQSGAFVEAEQIAKANAILASLREQNAEFRHDVGLRYGGTIFGVFVFAFAIILIGVESRRLHWVLANLYLGLAAITGGFLFDVSLWSAYASNRIRFTLAQLLLVCVLVGLTLQMIIEFGRS